MSVEHVDDPVDALVVDRAGRVELVEAADRRPRVAAKLAGEEARVQRAPRHQADGLVETERDDLVLDVASDERVVDLLADVSGQPGAIGHGQRLHDLPGGMIRTADVADLALA